MAFYALYRYGTFPQVDLVEQDLDPDDLRADLAN